MKIYKCPFCHKEYISKDGLYEHLELEHHEQLNNLHPAHWYFNFVNKKDHGTCIVCKKPTKFNLKTERYERLCSEKCKEEYRKIFLERMNKRYGKDHLLNSPEVQKKMLAHRSISGTYIWKDKTKTLYTGSYEKDFIAFMELFLDWSSNDILMPAPMCFKYIDEGKEHFYIPDVYIPSCNLIIEIKSEKNQHYRKRDISHELLKDKAVKLNKANYNYIKICDKKYSELLDFLNTFNK